MRLLLDESLPRQLAAELTSHEVRTVVQEGWAGLGNGELMQRAAAAGFQVLLTGDRNLQYQQDIASSGIAVVVIAARTNRMEELLPLMPQVLGALDSAQPGEVEEILAG